MEKQVIINLLKSEMLSYNNTRQEYKTLKTIMGLTRKLPYKSFNIRLTDKGYVNKGDLLEYITAYNYFGLDNYTLDYKDYDINLNGRLYEIKSVAINESTSVKHLVDTLVVVEVKGLSVSWYEIPLKENTSLLGNKIKRETLRNLQQYKKA